MTSTRCCIEWRQWQTPPAFRDVTLGGNAVESAGPGYDLVTGLGHARRRHLARNLLIAQAASQ